MEPLPRGDGLLVVPPFANVAFPHLGVHLLQAVAAQRGIQVRVLYASMRFASELGLDTFGALCNSPGDWLIGERIFARAAFGTPPFGWDDQTFAAFEEAEALAAPFAEGLGRAIADAGYRFVGCSTMFEQTAAAVAILGAVKRHTPDTVTLLGGANCDGAMADGLRALGVPVDHIFSGESEATFARWLDGEVGDPVVHGAPCRDLDALPVPDYTEYFEQAARWVPEAGPLWLSSEASRGCWWGERRHCTFCGLNGTGMAFRAKSPERMLAELKTLVDRHPSRLLCFTDNIMPHAYHRTVLPHIQEQVGPVELFFEQKANLRLEQIKGLVDAGCTVIQPGIESLSTPVLERMRKGVLARQNLDLMRHARVVGLGLNWNLLYGFPGDDRASYEAMAELLPLLVHLCPPNGLSPLSIDRFSPYFEEADDFGITELRPRAAYAAVLPQGADVAAVAYHFEGTWQSGGLEATELLVQMGEQVNAWRALWGSDETRPLLHLTPGGPGQWVLSDTRGLKNGVFWLNDAQARAVAVGGPIDTVPQADWAIRNRFAVALDGWCVALATAPYGVLRGLQPALSTPQSTS